jgi:hypothetical protein
MSASMASALHRYATHVVAALIVVVGVTGTMMFYRLYKSSVQELHAWLGMAFLLAIVLHVTRNRRQLVPLLSHTRMHGFMGDNCCSGCLFSVSSPRAKGQSSQKFDQGILANAPCEHRSRLGDLARISFV